MQKSGLYVLVHIQPQISVLLIFQGSTLNIDGHLRACYKDQCEQGGGHLKMGHDDFSRSC